MDSLASEMDSAKPWLPGITEKRQISNTALRKHTELLFPLPAPKKQELLHIPCTALTVSRQ